MTLKNAVEPTQRRKGAETQGFHYHPQGESFKLFSPSLFSCPLRPCRLASLHCNKRSGSQAARVSENELPREAFGVRPACWRCRKARAVRKREQAPRTPSASRS